MGAGCAGLRGERHPASKVTDAQRREAVERVGVRGEPLKAVAMDCGVTETTVAAWMRDAGWKRGYVRRN